MSNDVPRAVCVFYFLLSELDYDCPLLEKSEFDSTTNNMESLCH